MSPTAPAPASAHPEAVADGMLRAALSAFLVYYLAVARERVRVTRDEIPSL